MALGVAAAAVSGRAHVVAGTAPLSWLAAEADGVVHARITDASGWLVVDDPPLRRPVVRARILAVLKGRFEPGQSVRFAQHGHGTAEFAAGEEVLVFLRRLASSRELADTGLAAHLEWVSLQEHDAKYAVSEASREKLFGAVRRYLTLPTLAEPEERAAALRRATHDLLASGDARLASSALTDLALAPDDLPLLRPVDLPQLEPLLADARLPVGIRAGLLVQLERRGLVDGPARWVALLRDAPPTERVAAIRAAGAHPSAGVTGELVAILGGEDPGLAAEAAVALGAPGHASALAALVEALGRDDARLRNAAIRDLGGMGTDAARAALRAAATGHPDPATRRRARAELRLAATRPAEGE